MWVFRLLVLLGMAFPVWGQDWPTKTVKFVSPYPPGGSVDPLARLFAAKLSESLKQQFIVENRTGASGIIGTEYVAKSAPDGYTFVFIFDTHSVHQALNPKLPRLANNLELARAALAADLPQRMAGENDESFAARLNDAGVVAAASGQQKRAEAAFAQAIQLKSRWYDRAANNLAALGNRK